jgi:hypothetical protein
VVDGGWEKHRRKQRAAVIRLSDRSSSIPRPDVAADAVTSGADLVVSRHGPDHGSRRHGRGTDSVHSGTVYAKWEGARPGAIRHIASFPISLHLCSDATTACSSRATGTSCVLELRHQGRCDGVAFEEGRV